MSERVETTEAKKSGWTQWTPAEARRALRAWRKSGLPLATFARERGIGAERLRWWRNRLQGGTKVAAVKPRFVPAIMSAPLVSLSAAAVAIRVPGGAVLEILDVGAVPPEWVGLLMAAAGKASR